MMNKFKLLACLISVMLFASPVFAFVTGTPVPTDSRIKTFVYNANDVYRVLTHYGYQMNIEFGEEEEINTISVGDRSGWQITPDENRIFVRAMEDKAHTNMTVVTDQRTYQFDLYSAQPGQQGWDELVYVVRFYYPSDRSHRFAGRSHLPQPMMAAFPSPPVTSAVPPVFQMSQAPVAPPQPMMPSMQAPMQMPSLPPLPPLSAPALPPSSAMAPMPVLPPVSSMPALPPLTMQQAPMMPALPQVPMGQPLYSPALPPVSAPPMASPQVMTRPATPVPPVNVARKPFGMIVPPHVAVAPPPKMPHPRAPFIVNEMGKSAQQLAREYPRGSYRNPMLAPRRLPSLERFMKPSAADEFSSSSMNVSPMGLPLPSTAPGSYIQF